MSAHFKMGDYQQGSPGRNIVLECTVDPVASQAPACDATVSSPAAWRCVSKMRFAEQDSGAPTHKISFPTFHPHAHTIGCCWLIYTPLSTLTFSIIYFVFSLHVCV